MKKRNLFHFDGDELSVLSGMAPSGDVAPAEAGAEPPASPDVPLTSDGAGTPSPEAAAPAWTGPSRDEWEATQERLAYYANLLEQQAQSPQQPYQDEPAQGQQFDLDPFSDDFGQSLAGLIDERLQALAGMIDERLAPVVTREQEERMQEADARAKDVISDYSATLDGGVSETGQTAARQLAEALLPSTRERYGNGPRAAEMALREATTLIHQIEKAARASGADQLKNQLGTVANATPDPGAAGSAVRTIPDAADEIELVNRLIGVPGR